MTTETWLPNTDEIRDTYANPIPRPGSPAPLDDRTDAFDRWLTAHDWQMTTNALQAAARHWLPSTGGNCPTCSGPIRETTNMVCRTCGRNFMFDVLHDHDDHDHDDHELS